MKRLVCALALGLMAYTNGLQAQQTTSKRSPHYEWRMKQFTADTVVAGKIVFLGDSLTEGGEWSELLPNAETINRGISGDTTEGVLARLDEVIRHRPSQVFLLIGTNDLAHGIGADIICTNIFLIVHRLLQALPETKIYLQSILPVNKAYTRFPNHIQAAPIIPLINQVLRNKAEEHRYTFVDLHTQMADGAGQLRKEYTHDGLHLLPEGYRRWAEIIREHLP